jgi:hypothetical protein
MVREMPVGAALLAGFAVFFGVGGAGADSAGTAFPLPAHGAASIEPAKHWEWAFVSGNGRMGAMVRGQPTEETIVANHCRLFLPLGSREILPELASFLPELRRTIREKGYNEANRLMLEKAKEQGYPGLQWTDPFHPGFELKIQMNRTGELDGSKDVYVDLRHASRASSGWGTARNGASVTGRPLRIGSVTFTHGIGTHAPAEIVYATGGKYRWLTFYAGISADMTERGAVTMEVWLDGKKIGETPLLRAKEQPHYVSEPIAGAKEVRLVVTPSGSGIGADNTNFGNIRLSVSREEPKPDAPPPSANPPPEKKSAGRGHVRDYLRTEDFQTGEVAVRWTDALGAWQRRLFVSRTDNAIVLSIAGPGPHKVNCDLWMAQINHRLIHSEIHSESGWITCHNVYVKGKGGYDGAIRVVARGGQTRCEAGKIKITAADEVLLLMRIEPYREAGESSMERLRADLGRLRPDYEALLRPHARAHGEIFNRVTLDVGGGADRDRPTEELLAMAKQRQRMPPALLEKMYDAGRYMFISSSGELPPNLQGIWTGTWSPAWSGDFTLDANIQCAVAAGLSANMPEGMEGYFRLVESFLPDCRENARKIYGCRGILTNTRASNNCLLLHWGGWPGQFWMSGAGWLAHWFYDYYLYTGDREFLARRTVPLLKEIALFYEDMLFVDDGGRYRFSPSYSPETLTADNATMDLAVAREVLGNLIAACETLKIEPENRVKWQGMRAKLPQYRIDEEGGLAEFATAGPAENYRHRHHSHLYPVFQSHEFTPETTPELWNAAKVALLKKIHSGGEKSSFGRVQAGLAAAYLRLGDEAYGRLEALATGNSMYPSLITSHEPGQGVFNVDGNGGVPEIVDNMLLFALPGKLDLLPALPDALPRGSIRGILARGQIHVDLLQWDKPAGVVRLELTSAIEQTITVRLPNSRRIKSLKIESGAARAIESCASDNRRDLLLPKGEKVALEIRF